MVVAVQLFITETLRVCLCCYTVVKVLFDLRSQIPKVATLGDVCNKNETRMLEPPDHFTPTQQAIFYVTQYPCQHCLFPKLSTTDQFSSFFKLRLSQTYIALCWTARLVGDDDPIYSVMKEKVISQDVYDWVHLKVSYFETLWALCQLLAPRMAESLRQLGREDLADKTTALSLFRGGLIEKANGEIEASFGYVQVSGRKADTALKLVAKAIREGLTPKELTRLQNLGRGGRESNSLGLLIVSAYQNFKSKAVKAQFELFLLATANLCEKEATMARKRGSWGWNNGVKLTGSKSSVYHPVHS